MSRPMAGECSCDASGAWVADRPRANTACARCWEDPDAWEARRPGISTWLVWVCGEVTGDQVADRSGQGPCIVPVRPLVFEELADQELCRCLWGHCCLNTGQEQARGKWRCYGITWSWVEPNFEMSCSGNNWRSVRPTSAIRIKLNYMYLKNYKWFKTKI